MKVGQEYRFRGAESTTVRIAAIFWQGWRRKVEFVTMYNGKPVGETHTILYSYAKKHWIPA
jgi:hypothetical protein